MTWLLRAAASLLRFISWVANLPARFIALPAARGARWCEFQAQLRSMFQGR